MTAATVESLDVLKDAKIDDEKIAPGNVIAIAVLILSTFTVVLNELFMGVALPRVMADLAINATTAQWLTTGYMLTMAVVIPTTGFLMERFQLRTVFSLAMGLFALGTLVAIPAPGFGTLLAARVIQAVGTAIMMPLVYTSVSKLAPPSYRGRMMALVSIAMSVAPSIGPMISGLILSWGSWRWLFVTVLPISLICLAIGNSMIRVASPSRKAPFDVISVILSVVGFASLIYGLASLGEGTASHAVVGPSMSIPVGIVGVALFVTRQFMAQKVERAQLDLRPFSIRTFSVSAVIMVLFMTPAFGAMILLPVILQTSYGLDTIQTGLFMVPSGIMIVVMSTLVGRWYNQVGPRPFLILGALINASAWWFLSTVAPGTPTWIPLLTYVVLVAGQAMMWTPVFAASLGSLDEHLLPHGSAIVNTIQQLVGAAGIAIAFSIVAAMSPVYQANGDSAAVAMGRGAQWVYMTGTGSILLVVIAALFLPRQTAASSVPLAVH
jgi:DHA2 family lincomycin resistance protein-like MFS transporter